MRVSMSALLLCACFVTAGEIAIDPCTVAGSDTAYLQYDDGVGTWLTWAGCSRGVWFDLRDFAPGEDQIGLTFTEYWMYHHSSYPWDTSQFFAEVWTRDEEYPSAMLDRTMVVAVHFAPVFAEYEPLLEAERTFWVLVNTEMSSGGWPSSQADAQPPWSGHSYWYGPGGWQQMTDSDLLVRARGVLPASLARITWGAVKAIF
jgi:hypothetical protein